jgi:hypothetical protein
VYQVRRLYDTLQIWRSSAELRSKDMINLTIDGQQISVPEGTTILDAAKTLHLVFPLFATLI